MPKPESRGFTLIELLVVIAIISLLTAVVLSDLSTSRMRARNVQRIAQFQQFRSALELVQTSTGSYPQTPAYNCLGTYPSGVCGYQGNVAQLPSLDAAIAPYIPPTAPTPTGYVDGFVYWSCPANACTRYNIPSNAYGVYWYQEGANAPCGPASTVNPNVNGYTLCVYIPQ